MWLEYIIHKMVELKQDGEHTKSKWKIEIGSDDMAIKG